MLQSMGSRHVGSVVVACRLSSIGSVVVLHCPEACRIFPDRRLKLCPVHWQAILNHWTTRAVYYILFLGQSNMPLCVLVAQSCPILVTQWTVAHQAPLSIGFPVRRTGVGCHFLLQGIFLTQGLDLGLLHCRQIPTWATREANIFFIHSSVEGHLGCFRVLAAVNSPAMNTGVHVSFQVSVFSEYMPRSWIARS